jgi:hypothetical protein
MPEGLNQYPIYPETTSCECPLPGYCQRHRCDKPDSLHRLCQTEPRFFDLWERGLGPNQSQSSRQSPCRHRGDQVGEASCEGCNGRVRIKVFSCNLHCRCTLSNAVPAIASCLQCADYVSSTELPSRLDTPTSLFQSETQSHQSDST